ncbi:unnamed protein product [Rotaria sp. Silwood2]|nr:unnamed protein product [Rotaria sp. Silwood2]CAF4129578.1 unnamed protein product [Rotaria sp. Silwood2]
MKSRDLQQVVLSKYKNGDTPPMIFRHLNSAIGLRTIGRWCTMIRETGSIDLSSPSGRPRVIRSKQMIQKVKNRLKSKKRVSSRLLAKELDISERSVRRILKDNLGLKPYKKRIEPLLTKVHKKKRMAFANWVRNNFQKEQTLQILFSDEKMFDLDGMYNAQNDRIWASDRSKADVKGGVKQKQKFPQKVMVWLGVCSKGVTPLVIFDEGTLDHQRYIKEVLPVAKNYGNRVFGNNWTYQQDGAKPHVHHLSQQWCKDNFPNFIDQKHWPPNSPDLNPLDYCIWNEFVQQMNWDDIQSKQTLIDELKRGVKKIRSDVVLESCCSWTNRLYHLSKKGGDYLG